MSGSSLENNTQERPFVLVYVEHKRLPCPRTPNLESWIPRLPPPAFDAAGSFPTPRSTSSGDTPGSTPSGGTPSSSSPGGTPNSTSSGDTPTQQAKPGRRSQQAKAERRSQQARAELRSGGFPYFKSMALRRPLSPID